MIRKVALLAVAGSLALAGCGVGTHAETTKPSQLTEGVNISKNGIDVRNLFVLGPVPGTTVPAGSSLSVYGQLINDGSETADTLTGVSTTDGLAQSGTIKGGSLALPAHQMVNLQDVVTLKGTAKEISGGQYVHLKLQFRNAQAITVDVQIIPAQGPYATLVPTTSAAPTPGTASPAATLTASEPAVTATPAAVTAVTAKPSKKAGH